MKPPNDDKRKRILAENNQSIKIHKKSFEQLVRINNRLVQNGFDNVKVLISIAVDELESQTKGMSKEEIFAFIVSATYDLQKKGVVKENARSIGKRE